MPDALLVALAKVNDPEIRRPITDLGMVESAIINGDRAEIKILLTVAACPLRDKLRTDVSDAALSVDGVKSVEVDFGVMSQDQRQDLQKTLRGGATAGPVIPFAQPGSRTRAYAIASA